MKGIKNMKNDHAIFMYLVFLQSKKIVACLRFAM